MNFLSCNGSYIYVDNNLKILSSVSPGYLTNFPFVTLQLWKRQCKLQMRVLVFGSRTFSIVMSLSSNSLSMFNRSSINFRTQDVIASVKVRVCYPEHASGLMTSSASFDKRKIFLFWQSFTIAEILFLSEMNSRVSNTSY